MHERRFVPGGAECEPGQDPMDSKVAYAKAVRCLCSVKDAELEDGWSNRISPNDLARLIHVRFPSRTPNPCVDSEP